MENLNLIEILKDAPKGTKLYSPICGECELKEITGNVIYVNIEDNSEETFYSKGTYYANRGECLLFPSKDNRDWSTFKVEKEGFKVGDHLRHKKTGEVCFLTSKSQNREGFWAKKITNPLDNFELYISELSLGGYEKVEKFDHNWLKPFDRVLVRDKADDMWRAMLFSHIIKGEGDFPYVIGDTAYRYCIPFNEETKQLVGTADEEPEFYKN